MKGQKRRLRLCPWGSQPRGQKRREPRLYPWGLPVWREERKGPEAI